MVRGVELGVGAELDIGAGDSEEGFPVIESPSEEPRIVICKIMVDCFSIQSREAKVSLPFHVLFSQSFSEIPLS